MLRRVVGWMVSEVSRVKLSNTFGCGDCVPDDGSHSGSYQLGVCQAAFLPPFSYCRVADTQETVTVSAFLFCVHTGMCGACRLCGTSH